VETDNRLLMFNGTDYSLLWGIDLPSDVLAVSDTLIIAANGNTFTGLSAASGEALFAVREGEETNDTPTFFSAAVSPDGQTVATGEDLQIRLWNTATGEELAAWATGDEGVENQPNTSHVTDVAFRSDGLVLYSANTFSGKVFSWAMGSNGQLATFELVNIVRYTFTPNVNSIIAETIDYGFKAYDPRTGVLQREHPDIISAAGFLSFTSNASQVVAWGYNTEEGHAAALWDVTTDTMLYQFITPLDQPDWRSAAITPGGTTIALIDERGAEIFFYNASTGEQVNTIALP
jgi:WD40 repeat protein